MLAIKPRVKLIAIAPANRVPASVRALTGPLGAVPLQFLASVNRSKGRVPRFVSGRFTPFSAS